MDVYFIITEGQGDFYLNVVDKECFDWVNSNWPFDDNRSSGVDPNTPKWLIDKRDTEFEDEHDADVVITIGSYDNDRALACMSIGTYDQTYFKVKDALDAVKERGDELKDEYHGLIY